MKRSIRILLSLVAVIALVICVLCCLYIVQYIRGDRLNVTLSGIAAFSGPSGSESLPSSEPESEQSGETLPESEPSEPDSDLDALPTIESVVDFDELEAVNPDIYAWIEIPSLGTNLAVLQSPDNDEFYLRHAATGAYYSGGSIFSQRYNTKTFEDPMTVLYGHNYKNMFGPLNRLADADDFEACDVIRIYTRERVFEYSVFAAFPYSNRHLLFLYDFNDPASFEEFFASLDDVPGGNFRRELFPEPGDRVLTLSTCIIGSRMRRFLISGVLTAEYQVVPAVSE